ncbi:phosphoribosylglycinamide formyltransferase [Segniliparus rugosus]|uniref:Phosphoribosylglycinamide formyltransferase n=1 Tax=Segniliparus rugosus (strain ATCC BAA-974 / DSM 45345 / CCUG 50838 / CIP 108380 / JCM 13579 / CDC 945) TaxID=679197 RepID=E5XTF0_SEGRC|nr:phosphoribosylglycinamide formyltransferase [Segniliparus rugosus]EFV12362.1 phosphoribosylglycinamide formyltransferase [Segniliparus rugosus ATCC BAA-974]
MTHEGSEIPRSARIAVLASGTGSLFRSLLEAASADGFPGQVVGLVADRACLAESIASDAGVPVQRVDPRARPDRASWDKALTRAVASTSPDVVVCAGFMRVLAKVFVDRFPDRIVNSHPALLPSFPGAHAVRDALAYGVRVTGTTVHLVDYGVDTGPILAQEPVPVLARDTEETLHERIKEVERRLLPQTVAGLITGAVAPAHRKELDR